MGKDHYDEITRRFLLALSWVDENLNDFSIGYLKDGEFSGNDAGRIKPISELVLTISILDRCGIDLPFLKTATEWAWKESNYGDFLVQILLARHDYFPCCSYYSSLYQLGKHSPVLSKIIQMLANSSMSNVLPLQPWSRLALDYNLWKLGFRELADIRTHDLYVKSCPEPWQISPEIAYAITHEVFYLSDFGFLSINGNNVSEYLSIWVPYWSKMFIAKSDFDITCELSMVWSCIKKGIGDLQGNPLFLILGQQKLDGSFQGPKGAGSFLFTKNDSIKRRDFLGNYHTTLVFLMASAMLLRVYNR